MKKILIIGATSAIAEATARIWASRGDALFLVARNQERLDSIALDLIVRGAPKVDVECMDINRFDLHLPMLSRAYDSFGEIDLVLIAHGTLSNQLKCEDSVQLTMHEISTNALSTVALLTIIANRFEVQGNGTIAVISSVAGDRGRQSNYVYGSAKAMVSTFASGLGQRLFKFGVSVITIKPGFVDTPMTIGLKKGFLWASPLHIAKLIVDACDKKRGLLYAPGFWWGIMLIVKLLPQFVFNRLKL